MVLSSFNFDITEADLRARCDCTYFGTDALKAVDALRQLGFSRTAKQTISISELRTLIANGHYPIVYVDLLPIDGTRATHALVVIDVGNTTAIVLDPTRGERQIEIQTFATAWAAQHNLAILVQR